MYIDQEIMKHKKKNPTEASPWMLPLRGTLPPHDGTSIPPFYIQFLSAIPNYTVV